MTLQPESGALPPWRSVLAVVAHPDDESFGLGAVISTFVGAGCAVAVLCLTRGEASGLHGVVGDLAAVRSHELTDAARELGVDTVRLLSYPDSLLSEVDSSELAAHVVDMAFEVGAQGLLVFDTDGVTGHADHVQATTAAVNAAGKVGVGVLAWTVPVDVARRLVAEFDAAFIGRGEAEVDLVLDVDRVRQRAAVACHPSQAIPTRVLWRRLDLLGGREHLRWLTPDATAGGRAVTTDAPTGAGATRPPTAPDQEIPWHVS